MPQLNRTEIAAIAARLREHARRATIERNYVTAQLMKARTRNELAKRLRYLAATVEDHGFVTKSVIELLKQLDTRNPVDATRHIATKVNT